VSLRDACSSNKVQPPVLLRLPEELISLALVGRVISSTLSDRARNAASAKYPPFSSSNKSRVMTPPAAS